MHSVVQYSIYSIKGLCGWGLIQGLRMWVGVLIMNQTSFWSSSAISSILLPLPLCVVAVVGYARVAEDLQRAPSAVTVSCTIYKLA